ncbi:hypothetical protein GRI58_03845 [Porphyrobacter algicida]|uniref:Tetratricopeptide repeat protein n=1 Tax=Qipengyuania algicida TaxID=1836209 RepID=A0A845AE53_9SPHN|nr:hypothetical protein [Qipengyuania algicida]MXP27954.1 hypothetical protein [Qipengyuania algicida]
MSLASTKQVVDLHSVKLHRVTLAFVAVMFGGLAVANAAGNVVAKVDPIQAHVLAPWDGRITADAANLSFAMRPDANESSDPAKLAKLALRQDPTTVKALNVLAFQAQLRGDTRRANEIFAYSANLSRRELRPQIWKIESSVARGDIRGALNNYDLALRTSTEANSLLYPVLKVAISEPKIRAALLQLLSKRPKWAPSFLSYLGSSRTNAVAAMHLFIEGGSNLPATNQDRANLVKALISDGKYDDAWNFYRTLHPQADRRMSRDPNFVVEEGLRTPFDWHVPEDAIGFATLLRTRQGGLFEFSMPPATGGAMLKQLEMLPPGIYHLDGQSSGISQPSGSLPYWSLTCLNGNQLGRFNLTNSDVNGGRFSGELKVPAHCNIQVLSLIARSSDEVEGLTGQILHVALRPKEGR